jgi:hypothetical protein
MNITREFQSMQLYMYFKKILKNKFLLFKQLISKYISIYLIKIYN